MENIKVSSSLVRDQKIKDGESQISVLLTSDDSESPKVLLDPSLKFDSPRSRSQTSSSVSSSSTTGTAFSSSDPEQSNTQALVLPVSGYSGSLAHSYDTPVVGYEVMEERTRFTVFKLWVESKTSNDGWFVFRRYTDFLRLNRKLKLAFPGLRLVLPPKKWFGDNFDITFLEDRLLGLQAYVTNITNHPDISQLMCVREFFCLDSKPDNYDSIEASRAMCQSLDHKVHVLKKKLKEKDTEIKRLHAELSLMKTQQETLIKGLKLECSVTAFTQSQSMYPSCSNGSYVPYNDDKNMSDSILGIHNVNVTLLHMLERNPRTENKSHNGEFYSSTPISQVSEPALSDKLETLKLNSNQSIHPTQVGKISADQQNMSKKFNFRTKLELDSPTSSDSGYREEFMGTMDSHDKPINNVSATFP